MAKMTVVILSYNHEKYIGKCIESILSQTTNFEYDILFADDYSNDETRKIIGHYIKNHENKIKRRFLQKDRNEGIYINLTRALLEVTSPYTAFIEGDDWYSDNFKLQSAYDQLEKKPEAVMVHTKTHIYWEEQDSYENDKSFSIYKSPEKCVSVQDTLYQNIAYFNTVVWRTKILQSVDLTLLKDLKSFDKPIISLLRCHGKIIFIPKTQSVYRKHAKGLSMNQSHWEKYISRLKFNTRLLKFHYIEWLDWLHSSINLSIRLIKKMIISS